MTKLFIKNISILFMLSTGLFAVGGPHGDITSSTSTTTDNGEVCVYCHTPHGSNGSFQPTPLWNKLSISTSFTMYGASSPGVAGVTVAGTSSDPTPTGSSMACLSCHDGVSAMNSVINAPGSGFAGNGVSTPNGVYIGTNPAGPATMPGVAYKAIGLNGDLTDDHPSSIVYMPGRAGLKPIDTAIVDIFGALTISDLLRGGKVQCTSCHDPHGTPYNTYLRSHNTNSALCISCHEK
ncbi:MAG: cytochrome c3 family protein [Sulfurimonas sp.]|nr:cytochrome c3 family protein [Sulfurimonas sp.]